MSNEELINHLKIIAFDLQDQLDTQKKDFRRKIEYQLTLQRQELQEQLTTKLAEQKSNFKWKMVVRDRNMVHGYIQLCQMVTQCDKEDLPNMIESFKTKVQALSEFQQNQRLGQQDAMVQKARQQALDNQRSQKQTHAQAQEQARKQSYYRAQQQELAQKQACDQHKRYLAQKRSHARAQQHILVHQQNQIDARRVFLKKRVKALEAASQMKESAKRARKI